MNQASSPSAGRADRSVSRRQFGRAVAGAAVGTLAAPAILRGRGLNERLDIALIGVGGRGAHNLRQVASENIVALCDVSEPALDRAAEDYPHARRYRDFRALYDRPDAFDAVVVSTTEHTHAFATLPALRLGKHVYCEKPLTHNIHEARVVRQAAAAAGVATQMGNQGHASDTFRRIVELIRAGAIGPVSEVHVWVSRAWGWQSAEAAERNNDIVSIRERPSEAMPVPPGLDWDLWLGPAPERPFHEVYVPGPKWYRWWDFGNGTMSDLGSHRNDPAFWALELRAPVTVEAFGPPPHPELAPASMRVVYEFGPRGDRPPVRLHWYQGEEKPEAWRDGTIPRWPDAKLFVGTEGRMLMSDSRQVLLLPEEAFRDYEPPERTLPRPSSHHDEWLEACKTGAPTGSNFEYAGWTTEANHLGNVAYRAGKKLEWDAEGMRARNAPEADAYIRRDYRKGWSLS